MADPGVALILATHTKFAEFNGAAIAPVIGRKSWSLNGDLPQIKWCFGNIKHDAPDKTGGKDAPIATEIQVFNVRIWMPDDETCRIAKNNLIRAFRIAAGGTPNVSFGDWSWITEDHAAYSNKGSALEGAMAARLQVPIVEGGRGIARFTSQTHSEEPSTT